jgi:hypothetical protein
VPGPSPDDENKLEAGDEDGHRSGATNPANRSTRRHLIRVVAVPTEERVFEAESDDPRRALLAALGQIPLGYTIASVEIDPPSEK